MTGVGLGPPPKLPFWVTLIAFCGMTFVTVTGCVARNFYTRALRRSEAAVKKAIAEEGSLGEIPASSDEKMWNELIKAFHAGEDDAPSTQHESSSSGRGPDQPVCPAASRQLISIFAVANATGQAYTHITSPA